MGLCQERPTVADNGSMNSQSADVRQTLGVSDRKEDKELERYSFAGWVEQYSIVSGIQ
jgi:hypothetical protein